MKSNGLDFLKNLFSITNDDANFSLSENELLNYKNNPLFKNLNLTNEEILDNLVRLDQIVLEDENCKMVSNSCPNGASYHLSVKRNKDSLYFFVMPCPKMEKIHLENKYKENFLYNYYSSNDISNVILDKKVIGDKVHKTKNQAIVYFQKLIKENKWYGMWIWGKSGIGKTFLSSAFANLYAERFNKKIAFIYMPEFVNLIKSGFSNPVDKEYASKIIQYATEADVTFFDDIGAEFATDWFYSNTLLTILNNRTNNKKTTFFNSNLSFEDYAKEIYRNCKSHNKDQFVDRILDRIRFLVNNTQLHMDGKNLRNKEE